MADETIKYCEHHNLHFIRCCLGCEFEKGYAERSGVTVEWLHARNRFGVPCDCGWDNCKGWQMKHIDPPNQALDVTRNTLAPKQ